MNTTGNQAYKAQATPNNGYVYIIGAGPGDPELLTVKAARVLHEADVILYDDLVSSDLVRQFNALKIYTGKRKENHHFEQEAINKEILFHAQQGKIVARLKGGDPFIFGRGAEETEVLRKNGIAYEIIPGITAAHGASAYTEIPLTMRKVSSSVAFCTAHPVSKITVPDTDTIVYYMVASAVQDVLEAVARKGRNEQTPVALVQNATRYNQKIVIGTLKEMIYAEHPVLSPALLIIGESIRHLVRDNWYSRKRKVLIVGDDPGSYDIRHSVKVFFPGGQTGAVAAHGNERHESLELECIDEIYFSSPASVRDFNAYTVTIPARITITFADQLTEAHYRNLFGGDGSASMGL